MRTLLLSTLLLSGCSTWEGSWLLEVLLAEDSGNPDPQITYSPSQSYAVFYKMADGTAAAQVAGMDGLMTGAVDGKSFSFEQELSASYSSEDCKAYVATESGTFEGELTADGGLDGTLRALSKVDVVDCPAFGGDSSEREWRYEVTGVHVSANDGEHVGSTVSWGYAGTL
ncbi:MAG: hypothetical protein ACOZNI_15470 [Myxococcota bacterium]